VGDATVSTGDGYGLAFSGGTSSGDDAGCAVWVGSAVGVLVGAVVGAAVGVAAGVDVLSGVAVAVEVDVGVASCAVAEPRTAAYRHAHATEIKKIRVMREKPGGGGAGSWGPDVAAGCGVSSTIGLET
jgi:hypothetical protein